MAYCCHDPRGKNVELCRICHGSDQSPSLWPRPLKLADKAGRKGSACLMAWEEHVLKPPAHQRRPLERLAPNLPIRETGFSPGDFNPTRHVRGAPSTRARPFATPERSTRMPDPEPRPGRSTRRDTGAPTSPSSRSTRPGPPARVGTAAAPNVTRDRPSRDDVDGPRSARPPPQRRQKSLVDTPHKTTRNRSHSLAHVSTIFSSLGQKAREGVRAVKSRAVRHADKAFGRADKTDETARQRLTDLATELVQRHGEILKSGVVETRWFLHRDTWLDPMILSGTGRSFYMDERGWLWSSVGFASRRGEKVKVTRLGGPPRWASEPGEPVHELLFKRRILAGADIDWQNHSRIDKMWRLLAQVVM